MKKINQPVTFVKKGEVIDIRNGNLDCLARLTATKNVVVNYKFVAKVLLNRCDRAKRSGRFAEPWLKNFKIFCLRTRERKRGTEFAIAHFVADGEVKVRFHSAGIVL